MKRSLRCRLLDSAHATQRPLGRKPVAWIAEVTVAHG
jgi:hypothetical protein